MFYQRKLTIVGRWESRGHKTWVECVAHDDGSYSYSTNDGGGHLGKLPSKDDALKVMEKKIKEYLTPDAHKTPLQRVK